MLNKIVVGFLDLLLLALVIIIAGFAVKFAWLHFYKAAYPIKYEAEIMAQSEKSNVSPALVYAVIRTESGFNPNAESYVPARGLMQLTSDTFKWVQHQIGEKSGHTYDDMFDGKINILYGTELLRLLKAEFGSNNNALCAYHSGWGNAKKWLANPEYSEYDEIVNIPSAVTRAYVQKVLETEKIYNKLYNFELNSKSENNKDITNILKGLKNNG